MKPNFYMEKLFTKLVKLKVVMYNLSSLVKEVFFREIN